MRRLAVAWLLSVALGSVLPGAHALAAPTALGDFNGDGRADLAVGAPFEDVGGASNAGAVNVLYGASGLSATASQLWHQDSPSILGGSEPDDLLGEALAAGDFNGDGNADLAVGVPGNEGGGSVNVLYGSPAGLSANGNQLWAQGPNSGLLDTFEGDDFFGEALAAGDFNGDGRADLAVGVRFENILNPDQTSDIVDAGAVNVVYGSPSGLSSAGNQFWHQDVAGIADPAEAGDNFGLGLAAGDFNGNGRDDLAVGVTGEDVAGVSDAGAVNVLYGTTGGLHAAGNQFWHQASPGILGTTSVQDNFAADVAAGDFNGNGRDDLAVGVSAEEVGTAGDAGAVNVLYGSAPGGLSATGNQLWHQNSGGVIDTAEPADRFGTALAAGDFNGNARDDLAVGVGFEDVGTIGDAGAVNVLYGGPSALASTGNQFWHQNSAGVLDAVETGDLFGFALAASDLNGNGRADLGVGVVFENVGTIADAGAINILYGAASALSAAGNQFFHQDSRGIPDLAEPGDRFGSSLAGGEKAP